MRFCALLFAEGKPISAGLHMTLVSINNCNKDVILKLVEDLNDKLRGKWIKVARRNGTVDLEFGVSGTSWRIRAGEYFSITPEKQ